MEGDNTPKYNCDTQHEHRMGKHWSLIKFRQKCDVCGGRRYWPLSIYKCKDCSFKCHKSCWTKEDKYLETPGLCQEREQDSTTEQQDVISADDETKEPHLMALSEMEASRYSKNDSVVPYESPYDLSPASYESPYRSSPTCYVSSRDLSLVPYVSQYGSLSASHANSIDRPLLRGTFALQQQLLPRATTANVITVTWTYIYPVTSTTSLAALDALNERRSNTTSLTSSYVTDRTAVSAAAAATVGAIEESNRTEEKKAGKADGTAAAGSRVGLVAFGRSKSDVGGARKKSKFKRGNGRAKSAA